MGPGGMGRIVVQECVLVDVVCVGGCGSGQTIVWEYIASLGIKSPPPIVCFMYCVLYIVPYTLYQELNKPGDKSDHETRNQVLEAMQQVEGYTAGEPSPLECIDLDHPTNDLMVGDNNANKISSPPLTERTEFAV